MTPTSVRRAARTGRAAPMAPDERRRAIVDVVVPLLLQHGDGVTTKQIAGLRERVLVTTQRMHERSEKVVAVMMALRGVWMAQAEGSREQHPPGPPQFVLDSHRALLDRLTEVFEPHRAELAVEPRTAALLLRTLVLGARHPGAEHDQMLTPDQITVALLDGIRSRPAAEKD